MGKLPDLLTVAEVAEALKVNDETIHRWARQGRLPVVRLPGGPLERSGLKRFRREDIEALLSSTPAQSTDDPATPALDPDPDVRSITPDTEYGRERAA